MQPGNTNLGQLSSREKMIVKFTTDTIALSTFGGHFC